MKDLERDVAEAIINKSNFIISELIKKVFQHNHKVRDLEGINPEVLEMEIDFQELFGFSDFTAEYWWGEFYRLGKASSDVYHATFMKMITSLDLGEEQ